MSDACITGLPLTHLATCRRDVMEPLSQAGEGGCRVIAFDRPPYGLSQRPLSWEGGDEGSPYTNQASLPRS